MAISLGLLQTCDMSADEPNAVVLEGESCELFLGWSVAQCFIINYKESHHCL